MNELQASAMVSIDEPKRVAEAVCAHFINHDLEVTRVAERACIRFNGGYGSMDIGERAIRLQAEARDIASLCAIRASLTSHLLEISGREDLKIVWTGAASDLIVPPNFREISVKRVDHLTPHMRRITFEGYDLYRFDAGDLHVKLLFPGISDRPEWPAMGPNGLLAWPDPDRRPAVRTYTIRAIDAERDEITIDMVVHEGPSGPGGAFAKSAAPGVSIGMMGPGGSNVRAADHYLLAGDETALPAIARILESLPPDAKGEAYIEVAERADILALAAPKNFALDWICRDRRARGAEALAEVVCSATVPTDGSVFAWAGVEFDTFKKIRRHWRQACVLRRDQHLCVSYWRRGYRDGVREG